MREADTPFGKEFAQSFGLKISLDGQRGVFDACADGIVSVSDVCESEPVLLNACYIVYSLSVPDQKEPHWRGMASCA